MASPYSAAATGGAGDTPSKDEPTPGTMIAAASMANGGIRRCGTPPPVMTADLSVAKPPPHPVTSNT
jgi:hypothetical protein